MRVTQIANMQAVLKSFWLAGLVSLAQPAHANGLTEVEQTIFGMDCAPCAYGIEQGLKKLPGVTDVRVSLNEGRASVAFGANNSTTLESIRKVIRDNGFTPKIARVTVVGIVARADGQTWLEAPGLPRYRLAAGNDAIEAALRARPNGASVTVRGEIAETAAETRELKVTELPAAGTSRDGVSLGSV